MKMGRYAVEHNVILESDQHLHQSQEDVDN